MAINSEELRQASKKASIAGGFCQLSGAMLAVIGSGLTITTVLGGGGLYGLFLGGSATFLLALAGAPVAALGSIANSQKASKEMLLLYIRESAAEPARRRAPEQSSRYGAASREQLQQSWETEIEHEQTDYIKEPELGNLQINKERAGIPPPPPPPPPPLR
jgi:hypothetical protein